MDATNLAGLLPLLSTAVIVSVAAIVGYVVQLSRHKGDVNVAIKTASGSKISIEGSNLS